jgi:hypothetical protein
LTVISVELFFFPQEIELANFDKGSLKVPSGSASKTALSKISASSGKTLLDKVPPGSASTKVSKSSSSKSSCYHRFLTADLPFSRAWKMPKQPAKMMEFITEARQSGSFKVNPHAN